MEVPFFGFVAEGKHAEVDPGAAEGSGHEEEQPFRGALNVAALHRLTFIITHDKERKDIYGYQDTDEYLLCVHTCKNVNLELKRDKFTFY